MSNEPAPPLALFTTRQVAQALGVSMNQVAYMRLNGTIQPAYRLPGDRGDFLFTRAEVERVLRLSDRRIFRARRRRTVVTLDGLVPIAPRHLRRSLPRPPDGTVEVEG